MTTTKPRGYGEGSVSYRKDGRWVARYSVPLPTGGHKIKSLYAPTCAQARKKLAALKKDLWLGGGFPPTAQTLFADYVESWLHTYEQNRLEPTTYDHTEALYLTHVKPALGTLPLGEIRAAHIQELINRLSRTHAYSTVRKVKQLFSDCFHHAALTGDLKNDPTAAVILPKKSRFKPPKPSQSLEDHQVAAIEQVAAKRHPTGRPVYLQGQLIPFLLHTGLRRGELLALTWDDVDFAARRLNVHQSLSLVVNREAAPSSKYVYHLKAAKTQSGNRVVPLNQKAVAALVALRQNYLAAGIQYPNIACTKSGRPISNANLHLLLSSILARAGVERPLGLHQLRHTFATRALKAGVPIAVLSRWLGHANISTTYNTYIHALDSQVSAAVSLLETL